MRLDKRAAEAGLTRAQAKKLILAGQVSVNGAPVRDAGYQLSPGDEVLVSGVRAGVPGHKHIMLNKPAGVITATRDNSGPTVMDYLPKIASLGPVGRLDKDVTGLVIMTTDGQLAHRLISPRWECEKLYEATLARPLTERDIASFASGLDLGDFTAKPAGLEIISTNVALVRVTEGKFHQVKRMFLAIGNEVEALKRLSIGGVALDPALDTGEWRYLTGAEAALLYTLSNLEES